MDLVPQKGSSLGTDQVNITPIAKFHEIVRDDPPQITRGIGHSYNGNTSSLEK
jgi:hypothetical protein